ncbi:hypothetical protein ABEB36_005930 [Hypothenemus hampei]|uniref:Retrotransposon gag domain-containing protein n=1 Tax=Hypothenemus hampei TaxID=57062 RepID=A0ABD1F2K2_HYPHA
MSLSNSASNQSIPNISNVKAIAEYLPFFDEDKDQLECFIDRCEKKFYNNYYGRTTDSSLNDFVHNVIYSKLKGNVGNFLMCRPDLTSWLLIKEALREHYGDRIDRQTLTREFLQLNRHRNESIADFLERLKLMKSQVEIDGRKFIPSQNKSTGIVFNLPNFVPFNVSEVNSQKTLQIPSMKHEDLKNIKVLTENMEAPIPEYFTITNIQGISMSLIGIVAVIAIGVSIIVWKFRQRQKFKTTHQSRNQESRNKCQDFNLEPIPKQEPLFCHLREAFNSFKPNDIREHVQLASACDVKS